MAPAYREAKDVTERHSPVLVAIIPHDEQRARRVNVVIARMGWNAEYLPTLPELASTDHWELIVVAAKHVTPLVLQTIIHFSAPDHARLLVVADDRDPQIIADVLRTGSDDYLIYPFQDDELAVRVQSLVLRARDLTERRRGTHLEVDAESRIIFAGTKQVAFSNREWELLKLLLRRDGAPVSSAEIQKALNLEADSTSEIYTIISRIRRKFREEGFEAIQIETIHGHGYLARFRRAADSLARMQLADATEDTADDDSRYF